MNIKEKALQIAKKVHEGQKRKDGDTPYIIHPIRVANMVSKITNNQIFIAAAYLHDTIEDVDQQNNMSLEELKAEIKKLSPKLLRCVEILSHSSDETYEEYIKRMPKHRKLRLIKLCDIIDNLTEERPTKYSMKKYNKALIMMLVKIFKK